MSLTLSSGQERIFEHYFDPIDGTLCLPSGASMTEIQGMVSPHGLRFPLIIDHQAPLSQQITAATHAPASHRFGPYCDNIIGMNWRLPTGRLARIGERVVKTTTGYDWLRFLLHSGTRFGAPTDYVLRLRPDCGSNTLVRFRGSLNALSHAASTLLRSGWMHWFDSLDLMASGEDYHLRIWIHSIPEEVPLFEEYLTQVASSAGARVEIDRNAPQPIDGMPDLTIKTTPDRAVALAADLCSDADRSVAYCYSGVVHAWLPASKADALGVESLVAPHIHAIFGEGGDWQSRHVHAELPCSEEAGWIQTLEDAIHGS